jgi:hypothetical protein
VPTDTTTTKPGETLAIIIGTEGPGRVEWLPSVDWNDLREQIIGGWIARLGGDFRGDHWVALCDEEGGLKRLARNPLATALARELGWPIKHPHYLLGPVIFLGLNSDPNGPEISVPASVLARAAAIGVLAVTS